MNLYVLWKYEEPDKPFQHGFSQAINKKVFSIYTKMTKNIQIIYK